MNTNTGSIEIIYGPMFSGKSSELLRKIRRFEHARKLCLVLNFSHDNRYSNGEEMATHDK
jgi:thymidine kinase